LEIAIVILAAGKGTRMKSSRPKILHDLGGFPLYYHTFHTSRKLQPDRHLLVTGDDKKQILTSLDWFGCDPEIVVQEKQLGTGHAVKCALDHLGGFDGMVIVLYGDTPFVRKETLDRLVAKTTESNPISFLGFQTQNPGNYGRLILDDEETIARIVEVKDLKPGEKDITLCNSGIVCCKSGILRHLVAQLDTRNASGEYYLTDIAELARRENHGCSVTICDEEETIGINTQEDLAIAEGVFQQKKRREMLENGVSLQSPGTTFFSLDTIIHNDVVIEPNVFIGTGVTIGSGARIKAFTYLEGCIIGESSVIGPFARVREGTTIGQNCRIGNFVEIKKANIQTGTKASHLTYIGDAEIGENTNIGAGTIFCNYDGMHKHKTTIGNDSFIGSNTLLISPIEVGNNAMTAAGSVINKNVPDDALGISRTTQKNIEGFAKTRQDKKK